jgi:hypothetical protein
MADAGMDRVVFLETWRRAAEDAGRAHAEEIANLPASEWYATMAGDAKYRSYGTLMHLLKKVHDDLAEQPVNARELAAVVLEFVVTSIRPTLSTETRSVVRRGRSAQTR